MARLLYYSFLSCTSSTAAFYYVGFNICGCVCLAQLHLKCYVAFQRLCRAVEVR